MNVWRNRRLCFGGLLTDVYEDLLKKAESGVREDLILPEVKPEDVELVAERHKYARPRAKRQGPRYASCIPEPPVDEADSEDVARADAKHPPDRQP
jgi:hypothetical protein